MQKQTCTDGACYNLGDDVNCGHHPAEPKQKHWLTLLLEYAREAKALDVSQDYIDAVREKAMSGGRKTLDEVLAVEFYKLRQLK